MLIDGHAVQLQLSQARGSKVMGNSNAKSSAKASGEASGMFNSGTPPGLSCEKERAWLKFSDSDPKD